MWPIGLDESFRFEKAGLKTTSEKQIDKEHEEHFVKIAYEHVAHQLSAAEYLVVPEMLDNKFRSGTPLPRSTSRTCMSCTGSWSVGRSNMSRVSTWTP